MAGPLAAAESDAATAAPDRDASKFIPAKPAATSAAVAEGIAASLAPTREAAAAAFALFPRPIGEYTHAGKKNN